MATQSLHMPPVGRVLDLHMELAEAFANSEDAIAPSGVRSMDLLESACHRPNTSLMGTEKYSGLTAKAAALFHSLVKNHPFHNGNKRTALLTLIHVLAEHGRRITASDRDIFDFVVAVADNAVPGNASPKDADDHVDQIRGWINQHSSPVVTSPSGMRTSEFLDQCEKAGCKVRERDGGWLILGLNEHSIRIAGSTKKLDGPAIKRYVGMLGMSEGQSGIPFFEFQAGLERDRQSIVQYMTVFQWLAKT